MTERIVMWTVMPNHYQRPFIDALRSSGLDVRVFYYGAVDASRVKQGWSVTAAALPNESHVVSVDDALRMVIDWRERLHVVCGYSEPFLRVLLRQLCEARVDWVHWSEPSHPGLRWLASLGRKRAHARLTNERALGALGIGEHAIADLRRWGVWPEKLALVTYSTPAFPPSVVNDEVSEAFKGERLAFGFAGTLCHRKGVDLLLRAFAGLRQRTEAVLLLAGPDQSGGGYVKLARQLGVADRVLFRGAVSPESIPRFLACCDVLVLPSRFDGWGVVLNEGAQAGLALVASERVGAAYHLVQPGANGYRVRVDVRSLAAALNAYAAHPGLARLHGQRSRVLAMEYSAERNVARFRDAIASFEALRR